MTSEASGHHKRLVACLNCYEGVVWKRCGCCMGSGNLETDDICTACDGVGEIEEGGCPDCEGSGQVPFVRAILQDALRYVRANDPGWNGSLEGRDGVTIYSLAAYALKRSELIGNVVQVVMSYKHNETTVTLWGMDKPLAVFTGLNFGYGGEGPQGLITMLCDLFPEENETVIVQAVSNAPMTTSWGLDVNLLVIKE